MKVIAPGKLILSGEHSVVYGKPALAMAVNRYVTATISSQESPIISYNLKDLSYENGLTYTSLKDLEYCIKNKYRNFIGGDVEIKDVLRKPFELAQFATSICLKELNIELTKGLQIHVQSTIPMGCGMGSSAATILSIMYGISQYLKIDIPNDNMHQLGVEAENMQHGTSSGLDLQISLAGGCVFFKDQTVSKRNLPTFPMYLVNTGSPESSTGESVTQAASYFKSSSIGDDFAMVTNAMDKALDKNLKTMMDIIQENHALLVQIGVVPIKVQQFIKKINGAAKICGAGSVRGDNAGVVLVITEDVIALENLCDEYQYSILPIQGEIRGVHVV